MRDGLLAILPTLESSGCDLARDLKEVSLEYAGFWIRLGAGLVDFMLLGLIVGILYYFFRAPAVWLPSGFVISFVYCVFFWWWCGQTPGKMAVGIKVIEEGGLPLSWQTAVRRGWGYVVTGLTLLAGFILVAFDVKKQALHDKMANTYVVKLPVRQPSLGRTYFRSQAGYV